MSEPSKEIKTQLVVLGGGPGGYSAAFRAADLGMQVTLIEKEQNLGGVCLNVGCIPSKTLLHAAHILDEAKNMEQQGIVFGSPEINLHKLRAWKDGIVKRLAMGIKGLARKRKVELVAGIGKFVSANQIEITNSEGEIILVSFEKAIVAAGSAPITLPFIPEDPRIMDSTTALDLPDIPEELLVIGGGIIGLEMATVYSSLGSRVTIAELTEQLIPGIDSDIVEPLKQYNKKNFNQVLLGTEVIKVEPKDDGVLVTFRGEDYSQEPLRFDRILVAVGRSPNGNLIGADKAGIAVDQKGFVIIDEKMGTNIKNIFAVGDIVDGPMLAHKAIAEGRFVAEVITGQNPRALSKNIPSVAYTDPEVATVGLSESEAKKQNIPYAKGIFPWLASGRSLSLGRKEGVTKLFFDPGSKKILGGAIVGPSAGELIAEVALAISLGATAEEIAHVVHPHPTLSETTLMAAEQFLGTITDL